MGMRIFPKIVLIAINVHWMRKWLRGTAISGLSVLPNLTLRYSHLNLFSVWQYFMSSVSESVSMCTLVRHYIHTKFRGCVMKTIFRVIISISYIANYFRECWLLYFAAACLWGSRWKGNFFNRQVMTLGCGKVAAVWSGWVGALLVPSAENFFTKFFLQMNNWSN